MWRQRVACVFLVALLITVVGPCIAIGMLVFGGNQPGPASRSSEPGKPRLVQLALNQAPITDMSFAGQKADAAVAANDTDQTGLVVKLQRELKRVGCYSGSASGDWDESTRTAMANFNARIGARLALNESQSKFLTLVASYGNLACGPPCTIGYIPNADGKCTIPEQFANVYPTAPISASEGTADTKADSTGPWTASVAPASQVPFAATPMSPVPVTPTDTPLTTIAIIPSDQSGPPARKTSGWGSAAFGIGLQPAAQSQNWHSSRTQETEQYYLKSHH
jgi:hypothetical protein